MVWLEVLDRVLRPARPAFASCVDEAKQHAEERRPQSEARARRLADCVARIEAARARVFEAKDGVVTARMTALEAEWRHLSRRADRDGETMELWARITPPAWHDQKKWRVGDPDRYAQAAIALASDVAGVEAAEAAIDALRRLLPLPLQTRWCFDETDFDVPALLAAPLRVATDRLAARDGVFVIERAERLKARVYSAAHERLPERDRLARGIAHAAFVDAVWATVMDTQPSPASPLCTLWGTGYTVAWIGPGAVTLAIPNSDTDRSA